MNDKELETLFVEAVETTKKAILRRKLKSEVERKKPTTKEQEQTLDKLVNLGKDKIKSVDFTQ